MENNQEANPKVSIDWAKNIGGNASDECFGVDIDKEGNIYLTGSFENTLTLSDDISLTSNGGSDAFVAKLDQTGEVLWAEKLGGDSDDDANSVTVDEAGNTYFTGTFEDEAVFGTPSAARVPIVEISELRAVVVEEEADTSENQENEDAPADSNPEVTSISLDGNSQENIFVAKLDSSGKIKWAESFGGDSLDYGEYITVYNSGNTFITGSFKDTEIFGETTSGGDDSRSAYVAKLDDEGEVVWAEILGGEETD